MGRAGGWWEQAERLLVLLRCTPAGVARFPALRAASDYCGGVWCVVVWYYLQ